MADPRVEIKEELAQLIQRGERLRLREMIAKASPEDLKKFADVLDPEKRSADNHSISHELPQEVKEFIEESFKVPDFGVEYQGWYSPALRVIEQGPARTQSSLKVVQAAGQVI